MKKLFQIFIGFDNWAHRSIFEPAVGAFCRWSGISRHDLALGFFAIFSFFLLLSSFGTLTPTSEKVLEKIGFLILGFLTMILVGSQIFSLARFQDAKQVPVHLAVYLDRVKKLRLVFWIVLPIYMVLTPFFAQRHPEKEVPSLLSDIATVFLFLLLHSLDPDDLFKS